MLDELDTKGTAGAVSLFLGIGIVVSQAPVVAVGLAFVVAGLGPVAGGLVEGVMKMFGMT